MTQNNTSKIPAEMKKHTCDVTLITCMDFRFQKYIEQWEKLSSVFEF